MPLEGWQGGSPLPMRFTTFRSTYDNVPVYHEGRAAIEALFQLRVVPDKSGVPLYCPAEYAEGTTRSKENVLHVNFGVLDIDEATEDQVLDAISELSDLGLSMIFHTTHSHAEGRERGLFKCRILIPFDRPVEFEEWDRVWASMNAMIGGIADRQCRNPNAIYYFPSCPPGAEHLAAIEVINTEGTALSVEDALACAPEDEIEADNTGIPAPDPEVLARIEPTVRYQLAEAFMQRYPPAISGQHGDARTLRAAMIGGDFALTAEEFWPLLVEYNGRCLPPWDETELAQKLQNAERYRKLPIGWRLVDQRNADHVIARDLTELARRLTRGHGHGATVGRNLRMMLEGEAVVDGEPVRVFEAVAETLGRYFEQASPLHIAGLLADSIHATHQSGHRDITIPFFAARIEQAQQQAALAQARHLLAEQRDNSEKIRLAFKMVGVDRMTPYTDAEINEFITNSKCESRAHFDRRWILQRDKAFYFFVDGSYTGPFTADAHTFALQAMLPTGLRTTVITDRGQERNMSMAELMQSYGTVFKHIVADMTAQESRFEPDTQTLIEAPCPMCPVTPTYHPEVEQWLSLLTDDDKLRNKIFDWLACLPMVEEPVAALFLYGTKGVGKSLLAHACARLWTGDGPTELDDIVGTFNSSLASCPLVFGDEFVPVDRHGEPRTDVLRRMIQDRTRTYKRKFIPDAKLRGTIRLILAANGPDLIINERKHHTNQDIEAINERFLCVHVKTDDAKQYLSALQADSPDVAYQITHGMAIVEHAMWLHENRVVEYGNRFLVEGEPGSELEMGMMTGSGLRSEVCNWLASYITNPARIASGNLAPLVVDDLPEHPGGALLVTAKMLHTHWETYCDDRPLIGAIEKALGGVSERVGYDRRKYRMVNTQRVIYWAVRNGHAASEGDMTAALSRLKVRLVS